MFAARTEWDLAPMRLAAALAARRGAGLPVWDLTESNPTRCGLAGDGAPLLDALGSPAGLSYVGGWGLRREVMKVIL